jgi:hypothetical protein
MPKIKTQRYNGRLNSSCHPEEEAKHERSYYSGSLNPDKRSRIQSAELWLGLARLPVRDDRDGLEIGFSLVSLNFELGACK